MNWTQGRAQTPRKVRPVMHADVVGIRIASANANFLLLKGLTV